VSDPIQLDDADVKMGHLMRVYNLDRHHRASKEYTFVHVQDADGNEFALGFTPHALARAKLLAENNSEDIPQKSVLTDILD